MDTEKQDVEYVEVSPEDQKEARPRLVVTVTPEQVEPFGEIILTARVETPEPMNVTGEVVFYDATGEEAGRATLTDRMDSQPLTARLERMAPSEPGSQTWTARLESEDCECEEVEYTVTIAPHPISVTVWDIPPAIEQGITFPMTIGLKCPCGCEAKGWSFRLLNGEGQEIRAGMVGQEPWPGTTSLFYTCLDLDAPATEGRHEWTVVALPPEDAAIPHGERRMKVHLNVTRAPEVTLRIEAVDAITNAPVPKARVVVHPYRSWTNEDGIAEVRLPKGAYTVFVSRSPYFAFKSSGEITEDTTLKAVMHEDRQYSEQEMWA